MKNKILLVGGTGFVGAHLQQHAVSRYDVITQGRAADVRDAEKLKQLVADVKPNAVVHLAAITAVPASFKNPYETFDINFMGTLNLLIALQASGFKGRMLYVGSSEVYGSLSDDELPVTEEQALKPRNPYAVSKVAAERLCYQWSQTGDFDIVIARPFNHIGPGQSENFVVSNFAKQIVEIKFGYREAVLRVGDIDVTRDFTDVRDIVRAYLLLLERGVRGEVYNVCSNKENSVRDILNHMMAIAVVNAKIEQDKGRLRPSEQRRICGSFDKLRRDTGWQPKIEMEQTLMDILEEEGRKIP